MRRRRPVLAVALAVLAATGGSGPAWAEVAEPGTVTLTVDGTVQHAVVD